MSKTDFINIMGLIGDINSIIDLDWNDFVGYDQVLNWPLNERRKIEGSINLKIFHSPEHCRFLTAIPPNTSFNQHWHDCKETCTVLAGTMTDPNRPKEVYRQGQMCIYGQYAKHTPRNLSKTDWLYLLVDFYRIDY